MSLLKKQLLDLQKKCPQLFVHTQAILEELEEDKAFVEPAYIKSINGFVWKREMVKLIFGGSKNRFHQTVNMILKHHATLALEYRPYLMSQKIPTILFKKMMNYIDAPFVVVKSNH